MENLETIIKIPSVTDMIPSSVENRPQLFQDNTTRVCPLCQSEVRLFFINFNDKMLMCENTQCDFPFGYEELQFVKEDSEMQSNVELDAYDSRSKTQGTATCSVMSDEAWSEIDKMNRMYDSEDSQQFEPKALNLSEYFKYSKTAKEKPAKNQSDIQQKIENLQQINIKMREIKKPQAYIKDENYLKRLVQLQGDSSLLKPEEAKLLPKEKPQDCKVRFEVKKDSRDLTSIKIDFSN